MQTFTLKNNEGEKIPVTLEKYVWQVQYQDNGGGLLFQFDYGTGEFHKFAEIDTNRPFFFSMIEVATNKAVFTILYDPNSMQLFHFYRRGILDNLTRRETIYVAGYRQSEVSHHFAIYPDGQIVITNDERLIGF